MEWKARWIWEKGSVAPRNYYLCARKTFYLDEEVEEALLRITADSRYVLYVNGVRIGQGPARSWPFKLAYDTYNVAGLLKEGKNVISVLVQHFGISTFQYIEGRGGLLCQLDIQLKSGKKVCIVSDSSWKVHPHLGFSRRTPRISCQQAWCEVYDARKFTERWIEVDYDDTHWENAIELGPVGIEPWKELVPREISLLTEEPVFPVRVLRVRAVKPLRIFPSFDLRPNLLPGKVDANPDGFIALVATCIRAPRRCKVRIKHAFKSPWFCVQGPIRVNGANAVRKGEWWIVDLREGDNLFIMDVSGRYHEWSVNMIVDSEVPLEFTVPWIEGEYHWVTIGPFPSKNEIFRRVWSAREVSELYDLRKYMKPILPEHEFEVNVYSLTTTQREVKSVIPKVENIDALCVPTREAAVIYPPSEEADVELLIDFGKEVVGFLEFEVEAPEGTIFDWNFFEEYVDGEIGFTDGLNNTLRYVAREGYQRYHSIVRRGFRYALLTIRNFRRPVRIYRVYCLLNTYPVALRGEFQCSDYLLNRIWEMCRYTTRLCMEDTFVDCPAYEQTFWVGDSRIEMLSNYYAFGELRMPRRCLLLVADSLRRSSLPESQVPSGWQNVLTTWSLLWIIACYEYYVHSGDKEFLREIYPHLKKTCDNFLKHLNREHLLETEGWNMLDWAPMDTPNRGIITHLNAWLVMALRKVAKIAEILGKNEDKARYLHAAEGIKEAINRHLWSEERKAYIDCIHEDGRCSRIVSQQTNTVVYLCDCATEERRRIIVNYIDKAPPDFVKYGSPFAMSFALEALAKAGRYEAMLGMIREWWGMMLRYGATTCWETFPGWLGRDRITRSWCHAWGTGPLYVMSQYILGVRPLEPGFKKVLIEPHHCDLSWARGRVPTPYGEVEVSWDREENEYRLRVKLPMKVSGLVRTSVPSRKFELEGDVITYRYRPRDSILEIELREGGRLLLKSG